jgi:hypothetical protein
MRCFLALTAAASLILNGGCSSKPARIMPPTIDAVAAGKAAITEYDANGNGQIDGSELDKAASIKATLSKVDKNSDKGVSAEEITDRINAWKESKVGIMGCNVRVNLDGKPLENATITLLPEKFLGPAVKPATGKTGPQGSAMLTVDDPDLKAKRISGVQCGLYRVEITADGGKPIPAKYNTETTLGEEVAQDAHWVQTGLVFDLKSK